MRFDAKAAKQLKPDTHMGFEAFPGLRLEAIASRRTWTYRFKSPVDGRMRQQKLGEWPAVSYAAAIVKCRTFGRAATLAKTPFSHAGHRTGL